jgi:16S rRNA (guanine527-N7)-methyltransferase
LPRRSDVTAETLTPDRQAALRLVPLSDDEQRRLIIYQDLLLRWQSMLNLVSAATLPQLWTRHIADSAQLRDLAPAALRWADLGSGGGFPGLVIAILLAEHADARVDLIERDKRKAAFLQTVSRETGAPAIVHPASVEQTLPTLEGVDVVTSRATAALDRLLRWSLPALQRGATALFLKGRTAAAEVEAISDPARFDLSTLPSRTDSSGRIVSVRYKGEAIR